VARQPLAWFGSLWASDFGHVHTRWHPLFGFIGGVSIKPAVKGWQSMPNENPQRRIHRRVRPCYYDTTNCNVERYGLSVVAIF